MDSQNDSTENLGALHGSSRSGWRLFKCDECGEQWQETSRDIYSPSGDNCQCCGDWVHPFSYSQSPPVKIDDMGNVKEYERAVVRHGIER